MPARVGGLSSIQNRGLPVPVAKDPRDADLKEVTETLSEGLKTCHAVVEGYRIVLAGSPRPEDAQDAPIEADDGEASAAVAEGGGSSTSS